MHLVTSSLFLGTIVSPAETKLSNPITQKLFCRLLDLVHRTRTCHYRYLQIFQERCYIASSHPWTLPHSSQRRQPFTHLPPSAITPNPWMSLLQSTLLVHPDDHLCKSQRTLSESTPPSLVLILLQVPFLERSWKTQSLLMGRCSLELQDWPRQG